MMQANDLFNTMMFVSLEYLRPVVRVTDVPGQQSLRSWH